METLKGTVNRIIYQKEETGFHIISFHSDDVPGWDHEIVVKGTFFPLKEDDELTIYGEYIDDSKYGRQFNCETYEINLPTDDQIHCQVFKCRNDQGDRTVQGEKKIVKQFKDDTMRVIEEETGAAYLHSWHYGQNRGQDTGVHVREAWSATGDDPVMRSWHHPGPCA